MCGVFHRSTFLRKRFVHELSRPTTQRREIIRDSLRETKAIVDSCELSSAGQHTPASSFKTRSRRVVDNEKQNVTRICP